MSRENQSRRSRPIVFIALWMWIPFILICYEVPWNLLLGRGILVVRVENQTAATISDVILTDPTDQISLGSLEMGSSKIGLLLPTNEGGLSVTFRDSNGVQQTRIAEYYVMNSCTDFISIRITDEGIQVIE